MCCKQYMGVFGRSACRPRNCEPQRNRGVEVNMKEISSLIQYRQSVRVVDATLRDGAW